MSVVESFPFDEVLALLDRLGVEHRTTVSVLFENEGVTVTQFRADEDGNRQVYAGEFVKVVTQIPYTR